MSQRNRNRACRIRNTTDSDPSPFGDLGFDTQRLGDGFFHLDLFGSNGARGLENTLHHASSFLSMPQDPNYNYIIDPDIAHEIQQHTSDLYPNSIPQDPLNALLACFNPTNLGWQTPLATNTAPTQPSSQHSLSREAGKLSPRRAGAHVSSPSRQNHQHTSTRDRDDAAMRGKSDPTQFVPNIFLNLSPGTTMRSLLGPWHRVTGASSTPPPIATRSVIDMDESLPTSESRSFPAARSTRCE